MRELATAAGAITQTPTASPGRNSHSEHTKLDWFTFYGPGACTPRYWIAPRFLRTSHCRSEGNPTHGTEAHQSHIVDAVGGHPERGRWTSRRKVEIVLRILKGEPLDALSRELGLSTARLAEWRDDAIDGGEMLCSKDAKDDLRQKLRDCSIALDVCIDEYELRWF